MNTIVQMETSHLDRQKNGWIRGDERHRKWREPALGVPSLYDIQGQ